MQEQITMRRARDRIHLFLQCRHSSTKVRSEIKPETARIRYTLVAERDISAGAIMKLRKLMSVLTSDAIRLTVLRALSTST
jgi:hypothetical protein